MWLAIDTGITSTLYRLLLLAHILLAIVGFGGVLLNGLYSAKAAQRPGPQGRAISEANFEVATVAEYAIYAVPITGILLVWASDDAWSFADIWVWLSLVLVVVTLVVARTVVVPGHRRLNLLLAEVEEQAVGTAPAAEAEIARLRQIQGAGGAVLGLLTVAVIVLMIRKPTG